MTMFLLNPNVAETFFSRYGKQNHRVIRNLLSVLLMFFFISATATAQILTSDKPDYGPGSTATFTGSGYWPNEKITLNVRNLTQLGNTASNDSSYLPWSIAADSNGSLVTKWTVCQCPGDSLRLNATGQSSGLIALLDFTDGTWTLSPNQTVCQGVLTTLTFSVTTTGTPNNNSFKINFPSSFSLSDDSIISVTDGKTWTSSISGSSVCLTRTGGGVNGAQNGDVIVFNITVNTSTATGSPFLLSGLSNGSATACPSTGTAQSSSATVTVNAVPSFSVSPSNITANTSPGACTVPVTYTATATGTPVPTVTYAFSGATTGSGSGTGSGSTFNKGVTAVTLTATNFCSTATCSFTITVNDIETPSISCTGPVTVACAANVPTPNIASVITSDNCQGLITVTHEGDVISGQTCANKYTITRTYKATDAADVPNSSTCTQTITVNDNMGPTLEEDLPGGSSGNLCKSAATAAPSESSIASLYTDNCTGAIAATLISSSVTGDDCSWMATYTYSVKDACGNAAANAVVIYTGGDTEAPKLAEALPGGSSGNLCKSAATAAPSESSIASLYIDNCSEAITATLISSSVTGDDCSWTATYTYGVKDACGNAASNAVVVYTGGDTEAPVLAESLPGGSSGNLCKSAATTAPSESSIASKYTDNCTGAITATLISSSVTGDDCSWTATYTYGVKDACGNAASNVVVVYTGDDTEAPKLAETLPGGASGNLCKSAATVAPSESSIASLYTDNCTGAIAATLISSSVTGDDCSWTATYTYSVKDACGNAASNAVVVYTGGDTEAPVLAETLPGGSSGNLCKSAATTAPSESSIASLYTDNCTGAIAAILISSSVTGDDCSWTATYTYSVKDACDNAASNAVVVYTGGDAEAPTLAKALPGGTGGASSNLCKSAATASPSESYIASLYTDNCTGAITATLISSSVTGDDCNWTATYTYSVKDACGNTASNAVVVYTGGDTESPSFTRPANTTIYTDANCNYSKDVSAAGDVSDEADNCSTALQATFADVIADGPCEGTHIITRTWSLVDHCGNHAEDQVQTITVGDRIAPSITCPGAQTLLLNAACSATLPDYRDILNVSDNCTSSASLIKTQLPSAGTNVTGLGATTVTITVTDACGNSNDCAFIVNSTDKIVPVLTCPTNITRGECDNVVSYTVTATDNCSDIVNVVSSPVSGSTFQVGVNTVTSTATDVSGNSSTCNFTVTIIPNPNFSTTLFHNTYWHACNGKISIASVSGGISPYSYSINGGTTYQPSTLFTNVCAGTYVVVIKDSNGCKYDTTVTIIEPAYACNKFSEFNDAETGGWGQPPNGGNFTNTWLYPYFNSVYPAGSVTIGSGTRFITFNASSGLTMPKPITNYLPGGGTAAQLPAGTMINPKQNASPAYPCTSCPVYSNILASKTLAVKLNMDFDSALANFSPAPTVTYGDLIYTAAPFNGWTFRQILAEANRLLGQGLCCGQTSSYYSTMVSVLSQMCGGGSNISCPTVTARFGTTTEGMENLYILAYPNPTSNTISVRFIGKESTNYQLTLRDMLGKLMMTKEGVIIDGENYIELDLSNLPKAIYLLNLTTDTGRKTIKVMVE